MKSVSPSDEGRLLAPDDDDDDDGASILENERKSLKLFLKLLTEFLSVSCQ